MKYDQVLKAVNGQLGASGRFAVAFCGCTTLVMAGVMVQVQTLERRVSAYQAARQMSVDVIGRVEGLRDRSEKTRAESQRLAIQRDELEMPLVALGNVNPAGLVVEVANESGVRPLSVAVDKRGRDNVGELQLEYVDVTAQLSGSLEQVHTLVKAMEEAGKGWVDIRTMSFSYGGGGWSVTVKYRISRRNP